MLKSRCRIPKRAVALSCSVCCSVAASPGAAVRRGGDLLRDGDGGGGDGGGAVEELDVTNWNEQNDTNRYKAKRKSFIFCCWGKGSLPKEAVGWETLQRAWVRRTCLRKH